MKIAILANEKDSFVRPLAEGLARMCAGCDAVPEILYDGLETLSLPLRLQKPTPRGVARFVFKSSKYRKRFKRFVERLRSADVIVVVAHVPASLSKRALGNLELLRKRVPEIPIVNYDLVYLPTVEKWGEAMLKGNLSDVSRKEQRLLRPRPFGMERYDWYLVASPVSEIPMHLGTRPYSHIGLDIDDGSLYPEQESEFHVLVDFEQRRKDYPVYREVQIDALERSGVSYEVLSGRYTRSEIRAKYRKAAALMLSHRESFGLPICEIQASGGQIFTPRPEWAGAHWLKPDDSVPGPGEHSSNFVVYENTVDSLVGEINASRDSFDPATRLRTFRETHPELYRGNRDALADFLEKVESGKIHSRLHREHAPVGR
ncbi:MAG: hypothetical protein ACSLFK_02405 [Gemmatimonadaceae bacterium]